MSYKTRENVFNKIMIITRKLLYFLLKLDKHKKFKPFLIKEHFIPLLSFNLDKNCYQFNCYCLECPANNSGICRTTFEKIPLNNVYIIHEFDNDNIIRNYCG